MNKIKLTKEQKQAIKIVDLPEDADVEKWWYGYQIIKHIISPSHARAVLETVGIIADTGVPIEQILKEIQENYFQPFQCRIFGTEIEFEKYVDESDVKKVAQDIWEHPDKYSDYKNESESAYYEFLKYLWIQYPDGREINLADILDFPLEAN